MLENLLAVNDVSKSIFAHFEKVNLAEKPMAAGSKLISEIRFNSGFQSSEILIGTLANL